MWRDARGAREPASKNVEETPGAELGSSIALGDAMKTLSRKSWVRGASAAVAFTTLAVLPGTAHAAIAECGNMEIDANAQCSVVIQNNCDTQCAPASCEEACAAKLEQTC